MQCAKITFLSKVSATSLVANCFVWSRDLDAPVSKAQHRSDSLSHTDQLCSHLSDSFFFMIVLLVYVACFIVYVDGGERDSTVEENGDKCGGGREENGKEHG